MTGGDRATTASRRAVDVRLLGPVGVVVDGQERSVGRGAERALLALLALRAGQAVSPARLIDDLWGDRLPEDPGNALQTRVSKLRRALAAAGAPGGVVTRAPGYVLEVEPRRVDALRAAELIERARRADGRRAEELYTEALELWRGDPLAEFASEGWAGLERTRLEELRLTAVEDRARLRLAAGRGTEVLAEVEPLVAAHPLRERLRGHQMTALYQAGRQAEALAVYADLRRALAEQLGLDPSPELEALHDAILRHRADLAPTPAAGGRPPLPTRLTAVLGRDEELTRVARLCRDRRLVTLTGPGGAGKTTLATEAARSVSDRFPDGVVLVELAGVADPARVAVAVLDAIGPAGDAAVDPVERLVATLRDGRLLLVVDNCEHVVDACAVLVERVLVGCPAVHVLATSREPLAVPGEVQLPVRPLPTPPDGAGPDELAANDAVRLFAERAWAARPGFVLDGTTLGPVAEICRRLDGLPLALELAAARVGVLPVEQIAARLSDRFALLTSGPRTAAARHRTLQATLDWSHALLDDDEQVLLRRLAVFRGSWTLEEAEAACAGDPLPPGTRCPPTRCWTCSADSSPGRWSSMRTATAASACWRPCGSTPRNGSTPRASGPSTRAGTPRRCWPWPRRRLRCSAAATRTSPSPGCGRSATTSTRRWPGRSSTPPRHPTSVSGWWGHWAGGGTSAGTTRVGGTSTPCSTRPSAARPPPVRSPTRRRRWCGGPGPASCIPAHGAHGRRR
ncbi:ATP-binding protein [Pseudonocardia sp. RS010]|uniref:ATP-binding protein n=1 Tax=Pseudonocardia sp. RS010 TaxID=3385979 RepID=UPI00399F0203